MKKVDKLVQIKPGHTHKMPMAINEKHKLTNIPIPNQSLISKGATLGLNHTSRRSLNFNKIIMKSLQVGIKGITRIKVGKGIKNLGSSGLKMLHKHHTLEKKDLSSKTNQLVDIKGLKVHFKVKKVLEVRNLSLTRQEIQIMVEERQELLLAATNSTFLKA